MAGDTVPDKNIQIEGKNIGANTTLKLSVKTALWIMGAIFALVMAILTYSYFDLKSEVEAFKAADVQEQKEFIEKVDGKLDKLNDDLKDIQLDQREIKTNLKHIMDKQIRDNPVIPNPNLSVEGTNPE